jgi:hypothetical protein
MTEIRRVEADLLLCQARQGNRNLPRAPPRPVCIRAGWLNHFRSKAGGFAAKLDPFHVGVLLVIHLTGLDCGKMISENPGTSKLAPISHRC